TLAVQVPDRFQAPVQVALEETTADQRWRSILKGVGLHRESVMPLLWYVQRLHELGLVVDAWQTTYIHVLTGADPVLRWLRGTALRPLLARLEGRMFEEFQEELGRRLEAAYPAAGDVTLFPFPRLFFVATRDQPGGAPD